MANLFSYYCACNAGDMYSVDVSSCKILVLKMNFNLNFLVVTSLMFWGNIHHVELQF